MRQINAPGVCARWMLAVILACGFVFTASGTSHATIYNWSAGSGDWSIGSNWAGAVAPVPAADTVLYFTPASGVTVSANNDIASPFQLNEILVFGGSAVTQTINGGTLEFVNNGTTSPSIFQASTTGTWMLQNAIVLGNDLTLTGNGSLSPTMTLSGSISGGSKLKLAGGSFAVTNANTYSGGTDVGNSTIFGHLFVTGSGNLGSGSVNVSGGARLVLDSDANITSGPGSVKLNASYLQLNNVSQAGLSLLSNDSTGVLALGANSSAPLDFTNYPGMRLGSWLPGGAPNTVAYSGTITPAADNVYRFGGQDNVNTDLLGSDLLTITSLLTDAPGGAPRNVDIRGVSTSAAGTRAGRVKLLNGSNSYSGGTVIGAGSYGSNCTALSIDFSPGPGTTPLGSGDVTVNGVLVFEAAGRLGSLPNNFIFKPGSTLMFSNMTGNNPWTIFDGIDRWPDDKPVSLNSSEIAFQTISSGGHLEKIGTVSFSGKSQLTTDLQLATVGSTTIKVSALTRVGRGTLYLFGRQIGGPILPQPFGNFDQFQTVDATGLVAPNGMVVPWILGADRSGGNNAQPQANFLQLDGNNTFQFLAPVAFNSGTDDEVAFNPLSTLPASETCWALRASNLTIGAGQSVTIKSGGLITSGFGGASVTLSGAGTLRFGSPGLDTEALIYTSQNDATISCSIDGTGGLTKWGPFWLILSGNNTFTGGVQINEGNIKMGTATALNNNPVDIEGLGALDLNNLTVTVPSISGTGTIANNVTGTGTLIVDNAADCTFGGVVRSFVASVGSTTIMRHVALTKNGPATLILTGANSYAGLTSVNDGTLTLSGSNSSAGDYLTASGARLNFKSSHSVGNIDGDGDTTVWENATLTANHFRQNFMGTKVGATLAIRPAGTNDATSRFKLFHNLGKLDLADNNLVIDYDSASPIDTVRQQIQAGRGSGAWNGVTGFTSSVAATNSARALGYAEASTLNLSDFAGQTLDSTCVLVGFTFGGDSNLDGKVDVTDLGALATNWQTPSFWTGGDFNYDGFVDVTDLGILATNWQAGVTASPVGAASFEQALAAVGLSGVSVPEPACLAMLLGLGMMPGRRSSRRRR